MSYTAKHGPIHSDILQILHPEYVEFYNKFLLNQPAIDYDTQFDPSIRNYNPLANGPPPLKLDCQRKNLEIGNCDVAVFTPNGADGNGALPVMVYFHGGGWALGSVDGEISIATSLCARCPCVVVSVNYRLAPEHPFPAAVEDAWDVLQWVWKNGAKEIGIDPNRIAVGGASAGGQLSAVIAHMAVSSAPPIPIVFQLLTVPCTDLDPSPKYPSRTQFALAPGLPLVRMNFFYKLFRADPENWHASPIRAPEENWSKLPPAFCAIAGLDVLKSEGLEYARLMNERGSKAEVKVYDGVPHHFPSVGVLTQCKNYISDAVERVSKAFYA